MTENLTPDDYERATWELIELAYAGVSRHPGAEKLCELLEQHEGDRHHPEVLVAAMVAAQGEGPRSLASARYWVREQSWRLHDKVPDLYLSRARR